MSPKDTRRGGSEDSPSWLRQHLRRKSKALSRRFEAIEKKACQELLPFVLLPDFTDHGVRHARAVENNVSLLLAREQRQSLAASEAFLLLCGCLLHDVGMMVKKSSDEADVDIRIDHYIRSREFVLQQRADLGLSPSEAKAAGEICRAHGMPDLSYLRDEPFPIRGYGNVRIELLCALLRLADALDITAERAPKAVARSRQMSGVSDKHWKVHQCISEVRIHAGLGWYIQILARPSTRAEERGLYELRNVIQNELDTVGPILRSAGIFFRKVDLELSRSVLTKSRRKRENPFLRLASYGPTNATLFAGRSKETDQLIERILRRQVVVLIGESGVGKTSLVEAGVIPRLKTYSFSIVRFSFRTDPVRSLYSALTDFARGRRQRKRTSRKKVHLSGGLGDRIRGALQHRSRSAASLLIIGDHLEQIFTLRLDVKAKTRFVKEFGRVVSDETIPATFLFCIRQDYLPDLYDLSQDIPELYERGNTFKIHRLTKEDGREVLQTASGHATAKLSSSLIEGVVDDLCHEGEGAIYPPFLQIVGFQLYAAWPSVHKGYAGDDEIPEGLYRSLGGVQTIVNRYLEGLLDHYPQRDKPVIGEILGRMVTDYFTKKRITLEYLKTCLPECSNLEQLLRSLVQHRIVRRSLGEYELIHDFLAHRVIDLVKSQTFLSSPVRSALAFMRKHYTNPQLNVVAIARKAGVSRMHLAALFRKQMANTINQQLNAIRIAAAKEMLGKGLDPLSEIAMRAGFKSQSVFSRKFKAIEGIPPRVYRKLLIDQHRQP